MVPHRMGYQSQCQYDNTSSSYPRQYRYDAYQLTNVHGILKKHTVPLSQSITMAAVAVAKARKWSETAMLVIDMQVIMT